jgi:NADP-dependent aldehyde dehydrogenase
VVARYTGEADLFAALDTLPASLTASIHRGPGETDLPGELTRLLIPKAGRIVYDDYPPASPRRPTAGTAARSDRVRA